MKKKDIQDCHIVTISSFREVLQYMYYRFSEYYKKYESSGYDISGFYLLVTLLMINFFSIITFLDITFLRVYIDNISDIFLKIFESWITIILIFGTLLIIGIIKSTQLLNGKMSYWVVHKKFHKETPKQRRKRGWFIVMYMVLTPILFIIAVSIKHGYF